MTPSDSPRIRKRLLSAGARQPDPAGALDLIALATFGYSSENAAHPIENILDDQRGPGGTYWASDRENTAERIVIAFDAPQSISRLIYEAEELRLERTQEIRIELSEDAERSYRGVLVQEYAFSPRGATFQREDIRLQAMAVTHLRLTIVPNKNGMGTATLVSLTLYP
jgi:hypothetical protein